jgi:hypothetical protein
MGGDANPLAVKLEAGGTLIGKSAPFVAAS